MQTFISGYEKNGKKELALERGGRCLTVPFEKFSLRILFKAYLQLIFTKRQEEKPNATRDGE